MKHALFIGLARPLALCKRKPKIRLLHDASAARKPKIRLCGLPNINN